MRDQAPGGTLPSLLHHLRPLTPHFRAGCLSIAFPLAKGAELQTSSWDLKCLQTTSEQPLRRETTLKKVHFLAFVGALAFMFPRFPPHGTEEGSGQVGGSSSGALTNRSPVESAAEEILFWMRRRTEVLTADGNRALGRLGGGKTSSGGRAKAETGILEAQGGGERAVLLGKVLRQGKLAWCAIWLVALRASLRLFTQK